jgi:peptidoglycan/LPS O-acetylase OafA/YrhL
MCYSLYLVHLPVVNFLRAGFAWFGIVATPWLSLAVSVPASLLVARWFHVTVERRFLNTRTPAAAGPTLRPVPASAS